MGSIAGHGDTEKIAKLWFRVSVRVTFWKMAPISTMWVGDREGIPGPTDGWINYMCKLIVFWLLLSLSANLQNLQIPKNFWFTVAGFGLRLMADCKQIHSQNGPRQDSQREIRPHFFDRPEFFKIFLGISLRTKYEAYETFCHSAVITASLAGLILGLCPANERWRYLLCNDVSHWLGASLESALH